MITTLIGLLMVMPIVVGFAVRNLEEPVVRRAVTLPRPQVASPVTPPAAATSLTPLANAVKPPKPHHPGHDGKHDHGHHGPGRGGDQNEDD